MKEKRTFQRVITLFILVAYITSLYSYSHPSPMPLKVPSVIKGIKLRLRGWREAELARLKAEYEAKVRAAKARQRRRVDPNRQHNTPGSWVARDKNTGEELAQYSDPRRGPSGGVPRSGNNSPMSGSVIGSTHYLSFNAPYANRKALKIPQKVKLPPYPKGVCIAVPKGREGYNDLAVSVSIGSFPNELQPKFTENLREKMQSFKNINQNIQIEKVHMDGMIRESVNITIEDPVNAKAFNQQLEAKMQGMQNAGSLMILPADADLNIVLTELEFPMGSQPMNQKDFEALLAANTVEEPLEEMQMLINEDGVAVPDLEAMSQALEEQYGCDVVWDQYDDEGNLISTQEYTEEVSEDGTEHTKLEITKYDEEGYEIGKEIHETFEGDNDNYRVDTIIDEEGNQTQLIHGTTKNAATGEWEQLNIERKGKTEAIPGGFRVIWDTFDKENNVRCKETQTYTNCKYSSSGELIEFELTTENEGQRYQDGKIVDIHTIDKTKQYDAEVDDKGRLVSYKIDSWSNSSPDKKTTQQYTNHSFTSDDPKEAKPTSQTIETWEKGTSNDGNKLDSYQVQERTEMQYNKFGQLTGYKEKTYTQEKNPSLESYASDEVRYQDDDGGGHDADDLILSDKEIESYRPAYEKAYTNKMTTSGGKELVGREGYHWTSENTSRTGQSYDHAGRLVWYKGSEGKPVHTSYDHMGLVKANYDSGNNVREHDICYDGVGRKTFWKSLRKDEESGIKIQEWHYQEHNSLGQVVSREDHSHADTRRYYLHEGSKTYFTYDELGNQIELKKDELYDDSHNRWSTMQVVKTIAAIVVAVVLTCYGQTWGWQYVAACIAGLGAVSYAADKEDGVTSDEARKNAIITMITTAITYGMSTGGTEATVTNSYGVSIPTTAVSTSTQAGVQAVTQATLQATIQNATMTYLKNWALNTLSGMAQGMDANDAIEMGALSALGAALGSAISAGLSKVDGLSAFFKTSTGLTSSQVSQKAFEQSFLEALAQPEVWKEIIDRVIMKVAAVKIGEKNDGLTTAVLLGVINSFLNAFDDGKFNVDEVLNQPEIIQGMAKGAFMDWLKVMQEKGKLNDEWYAFAEGLGIELISEIDVKKVINFAMSKSINSLVTAFGEPKTMQGAFDSDDELKKRDLISGEVNKEDRINRTQQMIDKLQTDLKIDVLNGTSQLEQDLKALWDANDQLGFLKRALEDPSIRKTFCAEKSRLALFDIAPLADDKSITSPDLFYGDLNQIADSIIKNDGQMLLTLHGYNVSTEASNGLDGWNVTFSRYLENAGEDDMPVVGVHWQGDVGPVNFVPAVDMANKSGQLLVDVVDQIKDVLDQKGYTGDFKINIMTHSLGARVGCVGALELEAMGYDVNNMVLLAPAIDVDSFDKGTQYTSYIQDNSNEFAELGDKVNHLSVFWSSNDSVVRDIYSKAGGLLNEYSLDLNQGLGAFGIENGNYDKKIFESICAQNKDLSISLVDNGWYLEHSEYGILPYDQVDRLWELIADKINYPESNNP